MSNAPKILINGTDPEQEKVKISKEIFKLYPAHYINNRLAEILLEEGIGCKQWPSIIMTIDEKFLTDILDPLIYQDNYTGHEKEIFENVFTFYPEYIINQLSIVGIKNIPTYKIRKLLKQ